MTSVVRRTPARGSGGRLSGFTVSLACFPHEFTQDESMVAMVAVPIIDVHSICSTKLAKNISFPFANQHEQKRQEQQQKQAQTQPSFPQQPACPPAFADPTVFQSLLVL